MNHIALLPTSARHQRQIGMAVIGALMVVTVAAVVASRIIEQQGLATQTLIAENDRRQALWLMRGGLDWARSVLEWDERQNAVTHRDAPWAQPIQSLAIPVGNTGQEAVFSGYIEDGQAQLNLNNLAQGGQVLSTEQDTLERLLTLLDLPPGLAAHMAQRVAQSQSRGDQPALRTPLQGIGGLATVPGMTPDALERLRPFVTVLPEPTAINPNTARPELLSALFPELSLAQARLESGERDKGQWYNNSADFLNRTRLTQTSGNASKRLNTQSNWFRVIGQLALGQATIRMQALIHRQAGQTQVFWIQEWP